MRDIVEHYEAIAEAWADEHVDGDEFVCECGRRAKLSAGMPGPTDNPWAPPVCRRCAQVVPASERVCDECGDLIGDSGNITLGDGAIRHYPRCYEAMRARLDARRGTDGRFVR